MPSSLSVKPVPGVSVIIPALNEAGVIASVLQQIPAAGELEVIVVDGGSRDATAEIASRLGARVITTAAGRAHQMNAGAAVAQHGILLFLHADTQLPAGFADMIRQALERPGVVAGAFQLRVGSGRRGLRLVERLANFRSRYMQTPYGDQALFLYARRFQEASGFADLPILEDVDLVRRLRRVGRIELLPAAVITSARRWERLGVWRTTLINQAVLLAYVLGVSPARIARWYRAGAPAAR